MLEIIEINRQRLNLTKIGIIAKDISNAAEVGLDLNEVERYGLRVRLKMELLKDHLKGYISSNIDVQLPSSVSQYILTSYENPEDKSDGSEAEGEDK